MSAEGEKPPGETSPAERVQIELAAAREAKRLRKEENRRRNEEQAAASKKRKLDRLVEGRDKKLQTKRASAENDARVVNLAVDMKALAQTIEKTYKSYGDIERCVWDSFSGAFQVTFKHSSSAKTCVKGRAKKPTVSVTPSQKIIRAHTLHIRDPEALDDEAKMVDIGETSELINKIQAHLAKYGEIRSFRRMKSCLVFEYEKFDNCQAVLDDAEKNPQTLVVDGFSLLPVFEGVPKRSYEKTQQILKKRTELAEQIKSKKKQRRDEKQEKIQEKIQEARQGRLLAKQKKAAEAQVSNGQHPGQPPCRGSCQQAPAYYVPAFPPQQQA